MRHIQLFERFIFAQIDFGTLTFLHFPPAYWVNPSQGKERRRRKSKKANAGTNLARVVKPKHTRKAKALPLLPSTPSAGAQAVSNVTVSHCCGEGDTFCDELGSRGFSDGRTVAKQS